MNSKKNNFIYKYIRSMLPGFVFLLLLVAANLGLKVYKPRILKEFIDQISNQNYQDLIRKAVLFIVIALSEKGLLMAATIFSHYIKLRLSQNLKSDLFVHTLNLDILYLKKHPPGELLERIDGDVENIGNLFSDFSIKIFSNFILIFLVLIMILLENLLIGSIVGALFLILLVSYLSLTPLAVKTNKELSVQQAAYFGTISEFIECQQDLKPNGQLGFLFRAFYKLNRALYRISRKAALFDYSISISSTFVFAVIKVIFLLLVGGMYLKQQISIGSAYLILHYINLLDGPIQEIRVELAKFQKANASFIRVQNLFETKNRLQLPPRYRPLVTNTTSALTFEHVFFRYEGLPVLEDVSFTVNQGDIIGIVGPTGGGKTTIINLIFRFLDTESGSIYLNEQNIQELDPAEVRGLITYIPQQVDIFEGSFKDNITLFNDDISDEMILAKIAAMGLTGWFKRFPAGLQTDLSGGAAQLSEGEAQILAMVRAFINDTPLVVFDEVTSDIDAYTEEILKGALQKLLKQKTGLIISHKLRILDIVNKVLVLKDKKVLEFGEYKRLIGDKKSYFHAMINH